MRGRFIHVAVLAILLICQISVCLGKEAPDANNSSKYLDAVREFADNVLKYGRDTYGPKHTPLFVDGLNTHTHEPVKWISPEGERWILSNLASQQNLFRTLDGLTKITGDSRYRQTAMEAIEYAFENLRSPNGLLYWGIGAAYDAQADAIYSQRGTSLKYHYPYYELMWHVDSEKTKEFIESFWSAHILDWRNLDMDRLGFFNDYLETPWIYEYEGGPVFFRSKRPAGHSFNSTGSDLFYAGSVFSKLSEAKEPLIWSKRLAHRYVETRNPGVGISGNQYNKSVYVGIDVAQEQFGDDFKGHLVLDGTLFPSHPEIGNEAGAQRIIAYLMSAPSIPYSFVNSCCIVQLLLGEMLGADGKEFTQWALEELVARGKRAYRREDNSWIPMLTDGTSLEGYVCSKGGAYGFKGMVFKPIPAVPMDFWAYSLAFHATGNRFMWEMADSIATGIGLGDIGKDSRDKAELQKHTRCSDPYALLAFLELYKKTQNKAFLKMARKVGDNILASRFYNGFFVESNKHIYVKFDSIEPLVLLHLDATIRGEVSQVPRVWSSRPLFHQSYRGKGLVTDYDVIYTLTASPEPPVTLQEAATLGDIQQVKLLITKGLNIDARGFRYRVALHYAAENGHEDVTELLIANGTDVDATDGVDNTSLYYAARSGHKDIIELLLAKGADINVRNQNGDTPLNFVAKSRDVSKDIIELFIAKGADINAKNKRGQTPLHYVAYVARTGRKGIAELLIAKGADVNARNNEGWTPVDIAVSRNRSEVIKLLVEKGADVSLHVAVRLGYLAKVESLVQEGAYINAKNESGQTALHYAARIGRKYIAELLIAKGADVNAKNYNGQTPVDVALIRNRSGVVKLLVEKGADVSNIHLAAYLGDAAKVMNFIEQGSDVNTKDKQGLTPLHYATRRGHKEIVEVLLANGADVDARDRTGQTPAEYALLDGHSEIIELLISNGADVYPLYLAVSMRDLDKVRRLIRDGADVNKRTQSGTTAIYIAAIAGFRDITELLIDKGADVNAEDSWDWTSLHSAAEEGHRELAELLIAKGANVNARDGGGRTPLWYAEKEGHTEIAELLRKHGAKE